jgi:hypothetical protein
MPPLGAGVLSSVTGSIFSSSTDALGATLPDDLDFFAMIFPP